ncbi:hypothetical protein [Pseudanabaena sp. UWO310]|uniref:hypothetical protein n=1 Tax=Pseudanabaena sp. UWO310 TaxID=2480795 RepID=UPI00115898D6|nr:hypothetical protein [Pseudanabaena sp. UWO310]TYQ31139.1 hypothetical protein PseudUWO310_05180 [Pseudanabaena sp. UWO310]
MEAKIKLHYGLNTASQYSLKRSGDCLSHLSTKGDRYYCESLIFRRSPTTDSELDNDVNQDANQQVIVVIEH